MLSEISKSQKDKPCMLHVKSLECHIHRDRKQDGGCPGLGVGDSGELLFNWSEFPFGKMKKSWS